MHTPVSLLSNLGTLLLSLKGVTLPRVHVPIASIMTYHRSSCHLAYYLHFLFEHPVSINVYMHTPIDEPEPSVVPQTEDEVSTSAVPPIQPTQTGNAISLIHGTLNL